MKKMNKYIAGACIIVLSGCAFTTKELNKIVNERKEQSDKLITKAAEQKKQEPFLARVDANYVGDQPIDLPDVAKLPPIFFEPVTIRPSGPSFGTVVQAAKYLSLASGLAVRTTPDVDLAPPTMKGTTVATAPIPPGSNASIELNKKLETVKLSYSGTVLGYIKKIADSGGVDWTYKDGSVVFSRIATKTFYLETVAPGTVSITDGMTKGSTAGTGSTGGSNTSTTGSFNATSSVTMDGKYSVWTELTASIEGALTTAGKYSISESSGAITVTDTKDALERVRTIIDNQNALLGKQVSIEVRSITLQADITSQAGIDLSAVYQILNAASVKSDGSVVPTARTGAIAPPTVTSSNGGSMAFLVTDPASRWYGSYALAQAMNQFGNVLTDQTSSVITTNRMPAMTGSYNTQGYLASTTPATGGSTSAGTGVPGLTPGSVTVGSFLRVLPTIRNNNTILLNMSLDASDLLGFGSASTGQGQTQQQIQWANTNGVKTTTNLSVNQGESVVLVGTGVEKVNGNSANGIGGASLKNSKNQFLYIIVVTPRILKGA